MHLLISFGEKAACAACRVIDRLADLRIDDLYDKANDRARGIELASESVFLPEFPQQVFVDVRHGMDVIGIGEVNAIDNVEDVLEVIGRGTDNDIAVVEDTGDNVAFGRTRQRGQVGQ